MSEPTRIPLFHMTLANLAAPARRFFAIALSALGISCATVPEPARAVGGREETTVYLVRHAEKSADNPSDPELTPAGYARAESLAVVMKEAGIEVVVTSNRKRTVLTAEPVRRRSGARLETVPIGSSTTAHVDSVAAVVRRYAGSRILVVGHSNTIGPVIAALGGPRMSDLCDHEHSNLFILTLSRAAPTRMLVEEFGLPDPPGVGSCVPVRARSGLR